MSTPFRKARRPTYFWPLLASRDPWPASLASLSCAWKYKPFQDPIDSVNLRGTVLGGTLEVTLYDGGPASAMSEPPEVFIGIVPATISFPTAPTEAALKEYEDFLWLRQTMFPTYNHAAAATSNTWKALFKLTTKRKFPRGARLGIGIMNEDTSAFTASAVGGFRGDFYIFLED